METARQRSRGSRTTIWLTTGIVLTLFFAALYVWVRPVAVLWYYQANDVSVSRSGLRSANELTRLAAARGLGGTGESAFEAIPDLIISLSDESQQVASSAAWALGNVLSSQPGRPKTLQNEAVAALMKSLEHEDGEVRRYAAYAISLIGPDAKAAVPQLTELLDDTHMASTAARALGDIGPAARGAAPKLSELLKSSNAGERAEAAVALSKLKPLSNEAVVAIRGLMNDEVDFVRDIVRGLLDDVSNDRRHMEPDDEILQRP